jgi:hypothetical protein
MRMLLVNLSHVCPQELHSPPCIDHANLVKPGSAVGPRLREKLAEEPHSELGKCDNAVAPISPNGVPLRHKRANASTAFPARAATSSSSIPPSSIRHLRAYASWLAESITDRALAQGTR